MTDVISSRTPEGVPNHCPICDGAVWIEPSQPPGDAPCPNCGTLLWFYESSTEIRIHPAELADAIRERLAEFFGESLGVDKNEVTDASSFVDDLGHDSLDTVELVMELEEEFDINISEDEAKKLRTVGDVIDYLARRKRERDAPP